jgi:hypothetical protein
MHDAPGPSRQLQDEVLQTGATKASSTAARFSSKSSSLPAPAPKNSAPHSSPPPVNLPHPVDSLLAILEEIAAETKELHKQKFLTVCSKSYFKCRIRNYHGSSEIFAFYAKDLLGRLGPEWHTTPFFEQLRVESRNPNPTLQYSTKESIPAQLLRRGKAPTHEPVAESSIAPTPILLPSRTRMKPSRPGTLDDDSDHSVGLGKHPRVVGRPSGKAATLRLLGSKRSAGSSDVGEDNDDDDASIGSGRRGRKSAKTSHMFHAGNNDDDDDEDKMDDAPDDAQLDEDDDEDEDDQDSTQPEFEGMPPLPKDTVRIVVHAQKIPSVLPRGPNGTWVCEEEDCGYVVRDAEAAEGIAEIRQHFRTHEDEMAKTNRIQLAQTEGLKGRAPIKYAYFPPVLVLVAFCPSQHYTDALCDKSRAEDPTPRSAP